MNWQPGKYFHFLTEGQSMENLYADICAWLGLGLGLSQHIPQHLPESLLLSWLWSPVFLGQEPHGLLLGERTTRCLLRCGEIVFLVAMIDLPPVLPVPTQHFRFHCLRKQWSDFLRNEKGTFPLLCPARATLGVAMTTTTTTTTETTAIFT